MTIDKNGNSITFDWDKVDLYKLYVVEKKLTREIAEELGVNKGAVETRMRKLGITQEDKKNSYKLDTLQHDLIIGSTLGDGAFVFAQRSINPIFKMAHNIDQLEYLRYKYGLLKEFCTKGKEIREYLNKKFPHRKPMYDINTKSLPIFLKYSNMSRFEIIDSLNINSLLIWYLDDGSLPQSGLLTITCASFTLEECEYAIAKIHSLIGLQGRIIYSKREKHGFQGFYYCKEDSSLFLKSLNSSVFYNDLINIVNYKFKTG